MNVAAGDMITTKVGGPYKVISVKDNLVTFEMKNGIGQTITQHIIVKNKQVMMPQQKANELFTAYHNMIQEYGDELGQEALVSILAIKCSLIAVNEIIEGYEFDSLDIEHKRIMDNINFWDEVKEEINKL